MSSVVEYLVGWLESFSYLGIFLLLLLCGLGLPLPEEPILLAGGYVAYKQVTHLVPTILVSMVGILLGDSIAYFLGRKYAKEKAFLAFFKRFGSLRNLVRARRFMRAHGSKTVFIVRFMPGLRMPTYFMSGSLGVKFTVFFLYDFLAAAISAPVSVVAAWYFGDKLEQALQFTRHFHKWILLFIALFVLYWVFTAWRYLRRAALVPPRVAAASRKS